jgi:hypothetical protein
MSAQVAQVHQLAIRTMAQRHTLAASFRLPLVAVAVLFQVKHKSKVRAARLAAAVLAVTAANQ